MPEAGGRQLSAAEAGSEEVTARRLAELTFLSTVRQYLPDRRSGGTSPHLTKRLK